MKTLRTILLAICTLAVATAFCGAEKADGSLNVLWFFGWIAAAVLIGWLESLTYKQRRHV